MKTHSYLPNSWQATTDAIKQHLGIEVLTEEQASDIMKLYLKTVPIEDMIKILGEMK